MIISTELLVPVWDAYKSNFNTADFAKTESYKWPVLKQVYDKWKWNPDGTNAVMFEQAFKAKGPKNLWSSMHFYPITMYTEMLMELPEEANKAMNDLLDESVALQNRLHDFVEKTEVLRRKLQELHPTENKGNHYHGDLRAAALYLTLQYPEKYFLYKSSIYNKLTKRLNLERHSGNKTEKFIHYIQLANQLRDFIQLDESFLHQYQSFNADASYYSDPHLHLLVQDFIYFIAYYYDDSTNSSPNYWIFQANPKVYDVVAALEAKALKSWTVTAHKDKIKQGDKVILWITGEKSGCYALCEVVSAVENRQDDEIEQQFYTDSSKNESHDRVALKIDYNLSGQPVLKDALFPLPEFSDFKGGNQGTNYTATKEQYQKILELYNENRLIYKLSAINDKEKIRQFFDLCEAMVEKFNLANEDDRISFSTPKGNMSTVAITVGHRYVIAIINDGNASLPKVHVDLIALRKDQDIFQNQPGFYKFGEFASKSPGVDPPYFAYFNQLSIGDNQDLLNAWLGAVGKELEKTERTSHKNVHNPMFFRAVVDNQYRQYIFDKIFISENKMIKRPLNQILYGPPGTGKTYNTINKAVEIANPNFSANINRVLLKNEFKRLLDKELIGLITFHQSMSYEDFIEGIKPLKPDPENKSIQYDIHEGLFKKMCGKAESNFEHASNENQSKLVFEEAFEKLQEEWEEDNAIKFPLKTQGHDFEIIGFTESSIQFRKSSGGTGHTLSIGTLRDYYYGKKEVRTRGIGIYYPALLAKLNQYKNQTPNKKSFQNYVLIIDEINRGNISQIFGELITLIEDDKRMSMPEALEVVLPYSKEKFSVPPNLYIIGTMNTADRSIEALDTALRRRFTFVEMPPDPEIIRTHGKSKGEVDEINLVLLLDTLNKRIEKLLDKDHQIGHSYFMDFDNLDGLKLAFKNKVIPLLEEYFYGDLGKIGLILGTGFVKLKEIKGFDFASFKAFDDEIIADLKDRKVYEITQPESWSAETFKSIYQK